MTLATRKIRLILELRRRGITDTELLGAFEKIPREAFVPETFRDQTYEDTALPIGFGETLSQPAVVARMVEALAPRQGDKVLEIGTGTGYQTAILSLLCRRVYTVERRKPLLREAEARLYALDRNNFSALSGDGSLGWPEQAPFAKIIVSAAVADVPRRLAEQLDENGTMVIPIGPEREEQSLVRIHRRGQDFDVENLGPVRFVPLVEGVARGQ